MKKSGFTLVEIMIVVAIIGLLAAIAIPSFVKARNTSQQNACINNLRQIDSAKEQLAMATHLANGTTPDNDDVAAYIKGDAIPTCPGGGTIAVQAIGTLPTCTGVTATDHALGN
jgi:prepilin-type N-terminal cleavage/methylation domain-containing protein